MMIDVAFTHYPRGGPEVTVWVKMPAVPRPGDTIHLPGDEPARWVSRVSWTDDQPMGWHAEISLTDNP